MRRWNPKNEGLTPDVLEEEELADAKDLLNNELSIVLSFEGTEQDLRSAYKSIIRQKDLVLHSFESKFDYRILSTSERKFSVMVGSRFKVEKLDPNSPFWYSASQTVGGRSFLFKIDPEALGTEEFF